MGPGINGKTGELVRYALGLGLAAVVAYFTAIGALQERVSKVETLEQSHFEETQRSLLRIERTMERLESASTEQQERIANAIERIEATGADRRTGEPYNIQKRYEK